MLVDQHVAVPLMLQQYRIILSLRLLMKCTSLQECNGRKVVLRTMDEHIHLGSPLVNIQKFISVNDGYLISRTYSPASTSLKVIDLSVSISATNSPFI